VIFPRVNGIIAGTAANTPRLTLACRCRAAGSRERECDTMPAAAPIHKGENMNEEQLQRIEKGFAAATPLSIYNPHGDRALADIMVDLESRTIVPALIAEVRSLRAKLDAVPVDAITFLWRFAPRNSASQRMTMAVGDWLQKRAVQP
jgi:hypothetical protein